jgi:hypothetical protein
MAVVSAVITATRSSLCPATGIKSGMRSIGLTIYMAEIMATISETIEYIFMIDWRSLLLGNDSNTKNITMMMPKSIATNFRKAGLYVKKCW